MIAFLLAQTIAITGGTVYPVSGPKIEHATVLIRDGRIAAVGTNVTVPAGAPPGDASGKWVTPGAIGGAGAGGLRGVGGGHETSEKTTSGRYEPARFHMLQCIKAAR